MRAGGTNMKSMLIRIAAYIPVISFFWWVFVPGFFDPLPGPIAAQIISGIVYYGITYGFWIAAYELCYRAARYMRKPKSVSIPETQRLESRDARPTTLLEVRK
jgi:hypothetical protein